MQIAILLLPALLAQGDKLKVTDVRVGTGATAEPYDYCTMDYTGTLMNGKVFDSSTKPGRTPFQFILGVGQVIKGWDKGVVGMKVGGKRVLVIPPDLGYGSAGAPPDIPGNATLKFVIELRKIEHVSHTTLKSGHGAPIKAGDSVSVHYTGTFKDGKKFDSSYDRGTPITVRVGAPGMIPGFTLGLLGMREGERRKVVIPWALAYGAAGRPPVIPPKTDLVFVLDAVQVTR